MRKEEGNGLIENDTPTGANRLKMAPERSPGSYAPGFDFFRIRITVK